MVETVVPGLAGLLLVAVVALEQADGLAVAHFYDYLALLAILTRSAVGTNQVDVVLGIGDAHRAGLWCHPGECAERHRCLSLAKALHDVESGFLLELVEYCGVEGFACRTAVFKTAQVVFRQILTNHEAVDGGRSTEARHLIFLHLAQKRVSVEFLMVVDEHSGTGKPLPVELSPDGLAPSSISYGEMQRTLVQVVPEDARRQVAHGVEVVVRHHLRLAAGARSEVHQHCVIVLVDKGRTLELRSLLPFFFPVAESFHLTQGNVLLHGGAFGYGQLDLSCDIVIVGTNNGFHRCPCVAVDDVMLC